MAWRQKNKGGSKLCKTVYASPQVSPEDLQERPDEEVIVKWPDGVTWSVPVLTNKQLDIQINEQANISKGK